jgi:hypothetical protein
VVTTVGPNILLCLGSPKLCPELSIGVELLKNRSRRLV